MPTPVGVPEITPVGESESPGGSEPLATVHAYGELPPTALSAPPEYGRPMTESGIEVVAIDKGTFAVGINGSTMTPFAVPS